MPAHTHRSHWGNSIEDLEEGCLSNFGMEVTDVQGGASERSTLFVAPWIDRGSGWVHSRSSGWGSGWNFFSGHYAGNSRGKKKGKGEKS
jgi:hypothetical protein